MIKNIDPDYLNGWLNTAQNMRDIVLCFAKNASHSKIRRAIIVHTKYMLDLIQI
jgi:hypothetical protein